MFKTISFSILGLLLAIFYMRFGGYNVIRRLGTMAKEVKVEPYSMAFVTAPDNEVAKKLAGGLGKITPHSLTNTSARLSRKVSNTLGSLISVYARLFI